MMYGARCLIWEADIVERSADEKPAWNLEFAEEDAARRWLPVRVGPGQTFHEAWTASKHPEDRDRMNDTSTHALRAGLSGYEQEFRCQLADGAMRWLHEAVRIEPVPSLPGDTARYWRAVGVCTDITDRMRMQEQMVRTEKLAALGELVVGIAHEVNNPLAAVSGHAQLLALHPDAAVREDAAAIRQAADRASRILRSLLTFARQGGGEAERRVVAVNTIIETCEDLVRAKLRRADVELIVEPTPAPARVRVNETQIEQVLVNLVNNAEYALRGVRPEYRRIVIRTAVEPDASCPGAPSLVAVYVIDNGAGMTPEVASRIFDPFFTTKDVGEGTGLGLSLCHGIIEAHDGAITLARTAPSEGATFRLTLPIAAAGV